MNLGFGFPAVVAISPTKKMYSVMRGSFNVEGVNQFLTNLIIGKGGLEDIKFNMTFKKADKWDGKDAPQEEVHDEL